MSIAGISVLFFVIVDFKNPVLFVVYLILLKRKYFKGYQIEDEHGVDDNIIAYHGVDDNISISR